MSSLPPVLLQCHLPAHFHLLWMVLKLQVRGAGVLLLPEGKVGQQCLEAP